MKQYHDIVHQDELYSFIHAICIYRKVVPYLHPLIGG